jgi:hypothetical protein
VQVCSYLSSPADSGPPPPFIGQGEVVLQACCTVLSYIWWYGVQRRGVVGRPDESRSQWVSWRVLCPPKSGFEGGCMGTFRLRRRPYAGSSVADRRPKDVQWRG